MLDDGCAIRCRAFQMEPQGGPCFAPELGNRSQLWRPSGRRGVDGGQTRLN